MYRAVIIEDDLEDVNYLQVLIKKYVKDVVVVGVAQSVLDGQALILNEQPHIVFLNIQIENGKGFEVLEKFNKEYDFQVIACTSMEQAAITCYEYNITSFLKKPFALKNLICATNRVKEFIVVKELSNSPISTSQKSNYSKFLGLTSMTEAVVVRPEEIMYIKAAGRYCTIYLENGTNKTITKNIGLLEEVVDPSCFVRVHHSHIVNLSFVHSVDRPRTTYCKLLNGKKIAVSVRKAPHLEKLLHLRS